MSKIAELMPYWFYLAGSLCFVVGTLVAIYRGLQ